MKTMYVGMGLTQAPKEFRNDFQHELKTGLRALPDVEVLDFYGVDFDSVGEGVEVDVYELDRSHTENADLCVFIVDHPSIGLGMEIALRLTTGKPMLVFARDELRITRMLTGMCKKEAIPFVRYTTTTEIVDRVGEKMKELR